jgi:hypothetical protein
MTRADRSGSGRPHHTGKTPSDRAFGLTIAGVLLAWAGYSYVHAGRMRIAVIALAVVVAIVAALRPRALHGANVGWHRLGKMLERIVNPIVLGVVFVVVITPIALVMRLVQRDPLRRRLERTAATYWIPREDPPDADSWSRQF